VNATAAHRIVLSLMVIQGEHQGCASRPLSWTSPLSSLVLQLNVSRATQGWLARLLRTALHSLVQQSAPTTYAPAAWAPADQLMDDACIFPMGLVPFLHLPLMRRLLQLRQRRPPRQRPRPPRRRPRPPLPLRRQRIRLDWRVCPQSLQPRSPQMQRRTPLDSVLPSTANAKSTRSASIKPRDRRRSGLVLQVLPSMSTRSAVIHQQVWPVARTTRQTAPRAPQVGHARLVPAAARPKAV
jgi:hypothetical protein